MAAELVDEGDWNKTISAALPAVVSIKVNRVRSFDTASAGTIQATGFVVDAERGLILTNRHVAGPGPVVAEAVFQNNEEVPLSLAYYDPVHDFAFFRFDPAALRHMRPVALDLAPDQAEMTSEIVIIGNNAGEKCSIHRTTLARLDRNAPAYSRSSYNDFNTFYMHSASGTSGGSSGSPVLNKKGVAIALNAGGKAGTTAGFFLPLDRVARALTLLQAGLPVPRGSLQMVCTHQTYDEAVRLGLPRQIEGHMRADGAERGVLVVSEVLPEGPAAAAGLEVGDVVLRVDGAPCLSFVGLEAAFDDAVGGKVALDVCRGGVEVRREATVGDLHEITPSGYVEVGGAALNELSYQQARNYSMPVRGVYVAHPGYIGNQARLQKGSIIMAINGTPTPTLRDFVSAIAGVPHGEQVSVRFFDLGARAHTQLASFRMDRKWFGSWAGHRSSVGDWQTAPLAEATWLGAATPAPAAKRSDALDADSVRVGPPAGTAAASPGTAGASPTAAANTAGPTAPSTPTAPTTGQATITSTPPASDLGVARPTTYSVEAPSAPTKRTAGQYSIIKATTAPTPDLAASGATPSVEASSSVMPLASGISATTAAGNNATAPLSARQNLAVPSSSREGTNTESVRANAATNGAATSSSSREGGSTEAVRAIRYALVSVDFLRPFCIDGETGMRYRGSGLVLDTERGLVVVDRNTVTSTLGDVSITLGGRVTVPGTVEYVHPVHNFALVKFDPAAVPGDVIVRAAPLMPRTLRPGSEVTLVGLKSGLNEDFDASRRVDLICRKTRIANSGWIKLPQPNPPRYQIQNVETLGLEVAPSLDGGVLASDDGSVAALWTSCAYQPAPNQSASVWRGLPIEIVKSVSDRLIQREAPTPWRSLGATLEPISIAAARQLGLDDTTLAAHATPQPPVPPPTSGTRSNDEAAAEAAAPGENGEEGEEGEASVLMVTHVHHHHASGSGDSAPRGGSGGDSAALRGGDLLLSVDGVPIRSLYEAERATQRSESVALDVVRDGQVQTIRAPTTEFDGLGTQHVLGWAGVLVQETPDAVRSQRAVPTGGVYISYRFYGSPASRYDLSPTTHIVEVDGADTPNLAAFIESTRSKHDGEVVRIKIVDLEGRCRMSTLKLDLKYWPTFSLSRGEDGEWAREAIGDQPAA